VEGGPILVVDDDEVILSTVEFILADEGYPVAVAMNGEEALERVEEDPPRLILLDMKMPVMDGWGFAARYRQRLGPHAPIVVMTAAHDSRGRAAEIGADGYISKPFDVENLLAIVRRLAPQEPA
jgi:CheY-like chemotaxis protein